MKLNVKSVLSISSHSTPNTERKKNEKSVLSETLNNISYNRIKRMNLYEPSSQISVLILFCVSYCFNLAGFRYWVGSGHVLSNQNISVLIRCLDGMRILNADFICDNTA